MRDMLELGVVEMATRVRAGEISPVEATEAALAAIDAVDGELNACCEVQPERAVAEAQALADRLAAGQDVGALAGVPLGVKDLEDAHGYRTTSGDPVHGDDPPAERDSVEVARLRAAGCVVVAKTNTPAYGFHAETDNRLFGPTRNPWAPSRTAGGSSGGSGAAVAAGMLPLATGSDGGGSIRIPSAVCGIPGFKVTHGVVPAGDPAAPVWGPFSSRGPMARSLADIAYALDVVKGFTPLDLLSFELAGSFAEAAAHPALEGVRVAWCAQTGLVTPEPGVVAGCRDALAMLEAHGAVIEEVPSPFEAPPVLAWVQRAAAGTWAKIGSDRDGWDKRFLPAATSLAEIGADLSGGDVVGGEAGAHLAGVALARLFDEFDVLATPGMGGAPPKVGEPHALGPGWAGDFTLPFNLTRSPAAVVPIGFMAEDGDEVPIALQLAGPRLSDLRLMSVAVAVEGLLAPDRRPPVSALGR